MNKIYENSPVCSSFIYVIVKKKFHFPAVSFGIVMLGLKRYTFWKIQSKELVVQSMAIFTGEADTY